MLSLGLPPSQSTASVGPAGARRDRWLVPAGPSVAVDLAARAHWHGDRVLCSATGGGTSMRTAYPAGCLLTAEVASVPSGSQDPGRFTQQRWPQCRVAPRTQGVSLCAGGCQGSCHHICIHGRKEEGGAVLLRSPLLSKNKQLSRVLLTDLICFFDLICSQSRFKLQGRMERGCLGLVLGRPAAYDELLSHAAQTLFLSWGSFVSWLPLPL